MNTERIKELAIKCATNLDWDNPSVDPTEFCYNKQALEKFAALVAAEEREACAMEADYEAARWSYAPECREPCESIAIAIRARGNDAVDIK